MWGESTLASSSFGTQLLYKYPDRRIEHPLTDADLTEQSFISAMGQYRKVFREDSDALVFGPEDEEAARWIGSNMNFHIDYIPALEGWALVGNTGIIYTRGT